MENRHLFRGKRIDNGEWAEGYLFVRRYDNGNPFEAHIIQDAYEQLDVRIGKGYYGSHPVLISPLTEREIDKGYGCYRVNLNTICQCTGLKDKNGNLIWENDIVKFEDCGEEGYEYKEGFDFENKARVEFTEGRWSLTDFMSNNSAVIDGMYNHAEFMDLWGVCEVIGNKFDNPELLE